MSQGASGEGASPEPADALERADHLLGFVERRVAYVVEHSRRVVEAFFADRDSERVEFGEPTPDAVATLGLSGSELERYADRWSQLAPRDAAARAALAHLIGQRYGLDWDAAPAMRRVLGLDDPAVEAEHQRLFGRPIERALADRPEGAAPALAPGSDPIGRGLEWVSLTRGEALFHQGDPGDSLYVLVNGRLRVQIERPGQLPLPISEIGRGEMVGEMAVITGDPRSATVEAIRDAELVRLTRTSFDAMVRSHPDGMMNITRTLIRRLQRQNLPRRTGPTLSTIAVVPGGEGARLADFCWRLVEELRRVAPALLLTAERVDAEAGLAMAQTPVDHPNHDRLVAWLSELEGRHRYVVYQAEGEASEWTRRCVRQADRVLIVADATGRADLHPVEREIAPGSAEGAPARQELVLLHPRRDAMPSGTAAWLAARSVAAHHHVCLTGERDMPRLARRLTGRAVGLALAGGGARGFVHVGVIRALREAGVPIDLVGGTSMGSIVAAQCALEWDDETMRRLNRRYYVEQRPSWNYTLPLVSLSTAESYTRALGQIFGDQRIEDLWLPYFAISSNLSTGDVMVHDRGLLRRYVRASTSVPGVLPPVPDQGHLLVDGGILNNLPADVVRAAFEGGGKVIAVDCLPSIGPTVRSDYGEALTARRVLWDMFGPRRRRGDYRMIRELLDRVTMLPSVHQAHAIATRVADLYLRPQTDDLSMYDFASFEATADRGYVETIDAVRRWARENVGLQPSAIGYQSPAPPARPADS